MGEDTKLNDQSSSPKGLSVAVSGWHQGPVVRALEYHMFTEILVGVRCSAPVQTGPGAHPASYTMGTGSFPGVKSGWGVMLTPHPLPRKSRTIPVLPVWAVQPVQSLSACTRVHFTFTYLFMSHIVEGAFSQWYWL